MRSVDRYVEAHNDAVRTGGWDAFAELFTDEAEVRFESAAIGPFHGRAAILDAYKSRPPDDELEIRAVREEGDRTVAEYGWAQEPGVGAGELRLTWERDRIRELVITFE